jgi:hypothetical protein
MRCIELSHQHLRIHEILGTAKGNDVDSVSMQGFGFQGWKLENRN